uniref:Uncharacterized protein n=1 Tax=Arundo donax TaxID=35708 RepID=A0A0A9FIX2_ARUDO
MSIIGKRLLLTIPDGSTDGPKHIAYDLLFQGVPTISWQTQHNAHSSKPKLETEKESIIRPGPCRIF